MIGSESAHVTIPDVDLSRRHAVLRTTPRGVEVEDLGSRNGTFVDGVRISGRVRLDGPARLRMGASEFELLPEQTTAKQDPAAGQPSGRRQRPGVELVAVGFAALVSAAVVVVYFANGSSSGVKLASQVNIPSHRPLLVPFIVHAGAGSTVTLRGSRYVTKASSDATGGAFSLLQIDLHHGSEPPPHIHHHEVEGFYLLSGTMVFKVGQQTFRAGTGDFVFLPKGIVHGYQVTSGVARVLLLAVPGGLDKFFGALARSPALARQLSRRYGIQPAGRPGQAAPPQSATAPPAHTLFPFVTLADGGLSVILRDSRYTIKADTQGTGGAFALLQIDLHHGSEPPAHIHNHEAEIFYLLSGTMVFSTGGKAFQAGAGDLVFLPRGLQHAYEVTSGVANVLLLAVPSGLEQFFKVFSKNPGLVQQLGQKFGIQPGAAPVSLPPPPTTKKKGAHK
ncbi:MAG: cupin domain-containing protein [Actinobacteria bacterium]|nr:MAG: cupin domain-containing protein [Actinomycetota bacterium]